MDGLIEFGNCAGQIVFELQSQRQVVMVTGLARSEPYRLTNFSERGIEVRLLQVSSAQVAVKAIIVWPQLYCRLKLFHGGIAIAILQVRQTQIVVSIRIVGRKFDNLRKGSCRLI